MELEIDRNIQVLSPAQASQRIELPSDFYALTPEEFKREKQLRCDAVFDVFGLNSYQNLFQGGKLGKAVAIKNKGYARKR